MELWHFVINTTIDKIILYFVNAHSHEDKVSNETSNDELWRDVGPHRCSKRQSFEVCRAIAMVRHVIVSIRLVTNFIVFYFQQNPLETIREITNFIKVDADDDLLQKIVSQSSFEKMKKEKRAGERERHKAIFPEGYTMYRKGRYLLYLFMQSN